jgi:peptidoglycan glycosyltransferase
MISRPVGPHPGRPLAATFRARRQLATTTVVSVALVCVVGVRAGQIAIGDAWHNDPANAFVRGVWDSDRKLADVVTADDVVIASSVNENGGWHRVYPVSAMTPWLGVSVHGGAPVGFERHVVERGGRGPLRVTISAALTEVAVGALGGEPGAVVVMDVRDGSVLAAVDTTTLPTRDVGALADPQFAPDPDKPFDLYPRGAEPRILGLATNPGSLLKPILVGWALDHGVVDSHEVFPSETGFRPPGGRWISNAGGAACPPGNVAVAIAYSCNNIAARLGIRSGLGGMREMFRNAGFGTAPRSDLGLVAAADPLPSPSGASIADSVTLAAIGQGDVRLPVVTIAALYAGIANGGRVPVPRVDIASPPQVWMEGLMSREAAATVSVGMVAAVDHGTATRFGDLNVAAKTGTAETEDGGSHAWTAGFFPVDHPRVAFAVLRLARPGETLSGGRDAVPVAVQVLDAVEGLGLAR